MVPPSACIKTARSRVNLDDQAYAVLLPIAGREDVSVGQVASRAVKDYPAGEPFLKQPTLPLIRSTAAQAEEQRR